MRLRDLSAIARPVDPRFATNRAIAAVAVLCAIGDFLRDLLTGSDWFSSSWSAGGLGLTVFLAWALCREIDPDRDLSAFVAAGIAYVGTLLWGSPNLAVIFWLLLAVRIVNRSTGLHATTVDSLGLLILATWLAFWVWWPIGAIAGLAFLLDGWLEKPSIRHRVFGFLMFAVTLGAVFLGQTELGSSGPTLASGAVVFLLSLVFVPILFASGESTTLADDTKDRLSAPRVRSGQMLVLLTGVAAVLWAGTAGLVMLWPIWSAAMGASAFLLLKAVLP